MTNVDLAVADRNDVGNEKKPFPAEPIAIHLQPRAGRNIALIAAVAAVLILFSYHSKKSTSGPIELSIFMGLAILMLCLGLRMFWRPPIALIIDSEGIVYGLLKPQRIFWPDLKGAHYATQTLTTYNFFTQRRRWAIIALELVDPRGFQDRRKVYYSGYFTAFVPDYYPMPYAYLDFDSDELMRLIIGGIAHNSHLAPDLVPQATYEMPR